LGSWSSDESCNGTPDAAFADAGVDRDCMAPSLSPEVGRTATVLPVGCAEGCVCATQRPS